MPTAGNTMSTQSSPGPTTMSLQCQHHRFKRSRQQPSYRQQLQYKINNNLQAHSYPLFNGVAPRIITVVTVLPVWLVEGRTTTTSHRKSETRTKEVGVTNTDPTDHMALLEHFWSTNEPLQGDASKESGYRGNAESSPISSKASHRSSHTSLQQQQQQQ
ncbi:uncharacterized protein LOC119768741 [Culex quinquefasciatus]|uniref:uncharacterized protein LOC119768741 n=1 Tax=Culex quinquefasciatus TaxID=7176 RepID=UPI0018E32DAD|nr:uncharacterized protein LOC119768741 [Culex quinquefasciatus]